MNKLTIILSLCFGSGFGSQLEQWIAEALKHNPNWIAMSQSAEASQVSIAQAKLFDAPQLRTEWMQNPPISPMRINLGLEQMFPWPGKREILVEIEKSNYQSQKSKLKVNEIEFIRLFRQIYFAALEGQNNLHIENQRGAILNQKIQLMQIQIDQNRGSQLDLARLIEEQIKWQSDTLMESLEYHHKISTLLNLMGRSVHEHLDSIPMDSINKIAEINDSSIQNHPLILVAQKEALIQKDQLRRAELESKPNFIIGAGYQKNFDGEKDAWTIMAGMTLNFVPWRSQGLESQKQSQRIMLEAANRRIEGQKREIDLQVHHNFEEEKSLEFQIQLIHEQLLPQLERQSQFALLNWQNQRQGLDTWLEVLQRKNQAQKQAWALWIQLQNIRSNIELLLNPNIPNIEDAS